MWSCLGHFSIPQVLNMSMYAYKLMIISQSSPLLQPTSFLLTRRKPTYGRNGRNPALLRIALPPLPASAAAAAAQESMPPVRVEAATAAAVEEEELAAATAAKDLPASQTILPSAAEAAAPEVRPPETPDRPEPDAHPLELLPD